MQGRYFRILTVGLLAVASFGLVMMLSNRTIFGQTSDDGNGQIARGAGTTMIHGGTGSPNFVSVITTLAFTPNAPAGSHRRVRVFGACRRPNHWVG